MKKGVLILTILGRLFLGGFMIYGAIGKFQMSNPSSEEVIQKAQELSEKNQDEALKMVLYISGARQTGYFWEVLAICELLFGLLLVLQKPAFAGALLLLPITLHIFLFHVFLEPGEVKELLLTLLLFLINLALVFKDYKKWKHLLWM